MCLVVCISSLICSNEGQCDRDVRKDRRIEKWAKSCEKWQTSYYRNWTDLNSVALVRERTIPTKRPPPVGEVMPTFADRGCHVVSATDPHGRFNLCFLDRSRYFFIQVAPQLTSRGWVEPVPDPLLLRKSGSAGNRTRDLCICSQKLWPLDGDSENWPSRPADMSRMMMNTLKWR